MTIEVDIEIKVHEVLQVRRHYSELHYEEDPIAKCHNREDEPDSNDEGKMYKTSCRFTRIFLGIIG